jgi:Abnormal spindle-like microcephaly-assoc'd, ASPM-SPD-2-Hydin
MLTQSLPATSSAVVSTMFPVEGHPRVSRGHPQKTKKSGKRGTAPGNALSLSLGPVASNSGGFLHWLVMRAYRTHKQNIPVGIFTLLVALAITASLSLSGCGYTTGSPDNPNGLNAKPNNLSFNDVAVGSSSSLTSTLTNDGKSEIDVSEVTVAGAGLTATGVSAGTILTPGQSVPVTVTFTPASAETLKDAKIKVVSNAVDSPLTIGVSGTGKMAAHSVELSWNPSTTSGVVGYNVFRAVTSGGFGKTPLNPSPVAGTTYTDTTVQAGQTYFYVTEAVGANGSSSDSNEVSVTIP